MRDWKGSLGLGGGPLRWTLGGHSLHWALGGLISNWPDPFLLLSSDTLSAAKTPGE